MNNISNGEYIDVKSLVMTPWWESLGWFIGCVTNICWAAARFYWLEESPFTEIKEIQLTISKKCNLQYLGNTIDKIWEIQLTISEKYNNSIREKQSTISEKYNDNIWEIQWQYLISTIGNIWEIHLARSEKCTFDYKGCCLII